MSVTVYRVPMSEWMPGNPRPKDLKSFKVVASGSDSSEALRHLTREINAGRLDVIRHCLYIDEEKELQLGNIVKVNLKNTCRDLAIEATFREHERRREVIELAEILVETGGEVMVAEKYTETYEKWYTYFQGILKQNFA